MLCRYCGSKNTEYLGVTDGGGDYGTSICDEWFCGDCDSHWEDGCEDYEDYAPVDDKPVGDDGYPLDMDDETKAWLSTNRGVR